MSKNIAQTFALLYNVYIKLGPKMKHLICTAVMSCVSSEQVATKDCTVRERRQVIIWARECNFHSNNDDGDAVMMMKMTEQVAVSQETGNNLERECNFHFSKQL